MNNKMSIPKDSLENAFKSLPEERLPDSFRTNVMRQVRIEAEKARRREERVGLLWVIAGSLALVALAALSLLYLEIPEIRLPRLDRSELSFYLYIGALALLLLFADYKLRKAFRERRTRPR